MSYITNAKIEKTMLGIEDHGIMTFSLSLGFNSCGQGFGGYALDGRAGETGHGKSIQCIRKILETVGVMQWEDLEGKLIRIKKDSEFSGPIRAIGNIMEDKWFDIEKFWAENSVQ